MVKKSESGTARDDDDAGQLICLADMGDGFEIREPAHLDSALVFSSPHSGRCYPIEFLNASRLSLSELRRSEDSHVDALFAGALNCGAPLLRAQFPRAYLDVNREPHELDPRMFIGQLPPFANTRSLRVAGGLGTIARVVGDGQEIYAHRIPVAEGLMRIVRYYKPYHDALRQLLARAHEKFGFALLIDCHSMPSGPSLMSQSEEPMRADFVIGDRYGASCDESLTQTLDYELRQLGYKVLRNKPYAGGFITEHYGCPHAKTHAVQIEINRELYMDQRSFEKTVGFDALRNDLSTIAVRMHEFAHERFAPRRRAAE